MRRTHLPRQPRKKWYRMVFLVGIVVLILALLFRWVAPRTADLPLRASILILDSDIFRVISWDRTDNRYIVVSIPVTTTVSGTRGYGTYSLESLWKLDRLDHHKGQLVKESVEETLGIPVQYYIIRPSDVPATASAMDTLRSILSYGNLFQVARKGVETDIPVSAFSAFVFAARDVSFGDVKTLEIPKTSVLVPQNRADGSEQIIFDVQRFDAIIGTLFELLPIRNERLTVTVSNTTGVPALGTRASRLLSHLGVLVVSVGNETPLLDQCELRGKAEALQSETANLILRTLQCKPVTVPQMGTTDFDVRVGKSYQRRFEPVETK